MNTRHPDIDGQRFSVPQGAEACFNHFIETSHENRSALLDELSDGITLGHGQAVPIASAAQSPAYLLELERFIVLYTVSPHRVEVSTILRKRAARTHQDANYFTSFVTPPRTS